MNPLVKQIKNEIETRGPVSFARFMELALYAPGLGYYEREREIGRRGDFFTSVSVGPVFGELLAFQFAEWLAADDLGEAQLIEAGAHDGTLASDILAWMSRWRPEIFERLRYCIVEPSATRRGWQEKNLLEWLPKITWKRSIPPPSTPHAFQIIFSNELLDAMPVHRLAWNAASQKWDEFFVGREGARFSWKRGAMSKTLPAYLPEMTREFRAVLPDGYIMEISPASVEWWKSAAGTLARGKLLTVDYGLTGPELFQPERTGGTLRTYSRHRAGLDLLDAPGECDITAHVAFSAIETAGRLSGLATDALVNQETFLAGILRRIQAQPGRFEEWSPARLKQFQTLTHPEHLGRKFKALVQAR